MSGSTPQPEAVGIATSPGAPVPHAQPDPANETVRPDLPAGPVPASTTAPLETSSEPVSDITRSSEEWEAFEEEWRRESERVVPGLDNDDLDALRRMFDKQVQNVRKCSPPFDSHIPAGLDLHPASDEEFTVDKLRSNLERFYASVIVGLLRFGKEVQRLRRWEEGGVRSAAALLVYSFAWYYGLIITSILTFLLVLVLSPRSRRFCFDSPQRDGTGAETRLAGEQKPSATEAKASQWATMVEGGIMSMIAPKGKASGVGDLGQQVVEEAKQAMAKDMENKEAAGEKEPGEAQETSQKDKAMELYGQPTMKIIGGLADKWERMTNFLAPTPPFLTTRRGRVLWWSLPLIATTTLMSDRIVSRACGLILGFGLFGKPVVDRVREKLDRINPHWRERLILENNILSDVPTNAQLILRILRDAEHRRRPLPPPSSEQLKVAEDQDSDESGEGSMKSNAGRKTKEITATVKDGTRSRLRRGWDRLGRAKEEGFARITGQRQGDYRGKVGSALAKMHISEEAKPAQELLKHLPKADDRDLPDHQDCFYVYHKKHGPGHLIVHPPAAGSTPARVSVTTIRHVPASANVAPHPDQEPVEGHLTVSINDIVAIKKEGKNWPGRLLTSWAFDVEGGGGTGLELKIRRKIPPASEAGVETMTLGGIVRRDELFDRLLAAGDQRWEMI